MQWAVTGASGFIGRALVRAVHARGDAVRTIGRRDADLSWAPPDPLPPGALRGVDAVIHLAGEPIAQRWTPAVKQRIRDSRVDGTRVIAEACARDGVPTLVSGSAVGIYGDRGDEELTERSTTGADWLAEVGLAWEAAADPARAAGVRVVHPRIGVVLAPEGGALAKLLPVFRFGLGGPVGSGRQWMSWIARTDLVRLLLWLGDTPAASGVFNATAPTPVRNADFGRALGRALHRPAIAPAPAFAVTLLYGEMAERTILAGQRVFPRAALDAGFDFTHATLDAALAAELTP
jgi:hypothetical protein